MRKIEIVVIGAGVNGLSSAVKVAEYFRGQKMNVTLVSEDVSPNTTGDLSAGLWGPYLIGDTPEEKIIQWSKSSHEFFHKLWKEGKAEECGITMIPVYRTTNDSESKYDPCWKDIVFGFRTLGEKELEKLRKDHGRDYKEAVNFVSFCCEPTKFLPYLMKRFLAAGGRFEQRKISSLNELKDADLIINCSGLGSKELTNDGKFQAVRGQIARIKAPWLLEVLLHEDDDGNYIIPNMRDVILGGTHQIDDFNLNVSPADSAFILNGCKKAYPSICNAEVISEKVGLRPGRSSVRLETEYVDLGKPGKVKTPVIHNVGHGGCGVTLCWGCSDEVLTKTIEALKLSEKSAKL